MHSRARQRRSRQHGEEEDTPLQEVVAGVVIALVLVLAFGLLAAGWPWFWVVFPVGFGGFLPAALGAVKLYERRQRDREQDEPPDRARGIDGERDDALDVLRERFARGDIDEETFERQVGTLLETERDSDAEAYLRRRESDLNR